MTNLELKTLIKSKQYPYLEIYLSYGIDNMHCEYGSVILDKTNNLLIFFTGFAKYPILKATLSIDKIINVEFGDYLSPLSFKGSKSNAPNISITYKSSDSKKEILFSYIGFTDSAFKNLYKELISYLVEPQKQNEEGVIEL